MISTVTNDRCYEFRGLSTDIKPTDCGNGSIFFEINTEKVFMFNAENKTWVELA